MSVYGFRRQVQRGFEVVAYMHCFNGADIEELCNQIGMSLPTVKRLIRFLREELCVQIVWHPSSGGGGVYPPARLGISRPCASTGGLSTANHRGPCMSFGTLSQR